MMKNTKKRHIKFSRPVLGRGFVAPRFSRGAYHFMRSIGNLQAFVSAGKPISANSFFSDTAQGKQKKAQNELTKELHSKLENLSKNLIIP